MNNKLTQLNFTLFNNIDEKLHPFIQCYWQVKSLLKESTDYLIAPDGAMGLLINLGDKIQIHTENDKYILKHGDILLLGIHEHSVSMVLENNCHLLGIRFNPSGAFTFFKDRYENLYENNIFIKDNILLDKLQQNIIDIENIFDAYLLNKFTVDLKHENFIDVLQNIEKSKGNIEIDELALFLNISRRSLDRLFKKYVSTSANIYLRIIKIKYTREDLRNINSESLTQVGYKNGYFDQSHFIKEFKTFMKTSPKQYIKEKKKLS
jgi:AraC-like DNA-binding protein